MNTIIRNSLLAFAVVGALSLSACKTTDDSMETPEPASAPADTTTPTDSTMPTDPATMPPEDPTQSEPAPTTP